MSESDAELIELGQSLYAMSPPHVQQRPQCRTMKRLADRLAELAKPTPWRSTSELPTKKERDGEFWLRLERMGKLRVVQDVYVPSADDLYSCNGENTVWRVTGWKPIVKPEP